MLEEMIFRGFVVQQVELELCSNICPHLQAHSHSHLSLNILISQSAKSDSELTEFNEGDVKIFLDLTKFYKWQISTTGESHLLYTVECLGDDIIDNSILSFKVDQYMIYSAIYLMENGLTGICAISQLDHP